jgi:hypothetical protein
MNFAKENNIYSIIESYRDNAERDIKNMKLDIDELKNYALKYFMNYFKYLILSKS